MIQLFAKNDNIFIFFVAQCTVAALCNCPVLVKSVELRDQVTGSRHSN